MAKHIAKQEKEGDMFIIELVGLLHDLEDSKFSKTHEELLKTRQLLKLWGSDLETTEKVIKAISQISFKGGMNKNIADTSEAKIVQDSDRLDAIGAIGIARVFAYGGYKNRPFYDPGIGLKKHKNLNSYRNSPGTSINHFYEKLLLLKGKLNTKAAKKIAFKRHKILKDFLREFHKEWNFK